MTVRHSPNDILRAESGVSAKKYAGPGRLHGFFVNQRHAPPVELNAEVALDPRKRILLADCHEDIVAGNVFVRLTGGYEEPLALVADGGLHLLEKNARQPSHRMCESFRDHKVGNDD